MKIYSRHVSLLVGSLLMLLLTCSRVAAEKEIAVLDPIFVEGFRHEVANRAFARLTTEKMAESVGNKDSRAFWSAYHLLETFNEPIYQHVADKWLVDTSVRWFTRAKAGAIARCPQGLHSWLLSATLTRTEDYVEILKALRAIGPESEKWFLEYMVAQEEIQVVIMKSALAGDYVDAVSHVEQFIAQNEKTSAIANLSAVNK